MIPIKITEFNDRILCFLSADSAGKCHAHRVSASSIHSISEFKGQLLVAMPDRNIVVPMYYLSMLRSIVSPDRIHVEA